MVERPDNQDQRKDGEPPGDDSSAGDAMRDDEHLVIEPESVFESAAADEATVVDFPLPRTPDASDPTQVARFDDTAPDAPTIADRPIAQPPRTGGASPVVEFDDYPEDGTTLADVPIEPPPSSPAPDAPTVADAPHPDAPATPPHEEIPAPDSRDVADADQPTQADVPIESLDDYAAADERTVIDQPVPRRPVAGDPDAVAHFDDAAPDAPTLADQPISVEFDNADADGPTVADQPISVSFDDAEADGPTLADAPRNEPVVFDNAKDDDPTICDTPSPGAVVFDDAADDDTTLMDAPQRDAVVFDNVADDAPTVSDQPGSVNFDDAAPDAPTESLDPVVMGDGPASPDAHTVADGPEVDAPDRVEPDATTRAEGKVTAGRQRVAPDQPTTFAAPGTADDDAPIERPLPTEIGGYRITRILGTGGMSIVYAAVQKQPRRPVALKMMKGDATIAARALRRFKQEVEILGRLNHPCIAQVYDAGTHDDGSGAMPFFVMEYVPAAKTILQYAAEKNLDIVDRLKLFVKVCAAIEHGHRNKIVHRDLKPSNLLIDASGMPKIIDFGVARAMEMNVGGQTMATEAGRLVGTIQYMSPEQVATTQVDIDTRSDVYAMGVLLYKLLTGKHPYNLEGLPVYTAVQMINDVIPPRPSEVNPELAGDLETILLKALEKDRTRRYRSAGSMGRDLVRFLAHKPINARRASLGYRAKLMYKRRRALVLSSLTIAMVVIVGGGAWWAWAAWVESTGQRDRAELQATLQAEIDAERDARIAAEEAAANVVVPDTRVGYAYREHEGVITSLLFSPDGSSLVSGANDRLALGFEIGGQTVRFASDNQDAAPDQLAMSADGATLATASSDGAIVLLDMSSGRLIKRMSFAGGTMRCLAMSPGGDRLAYGAADLTMRIVDVESGREQVVRSSTGAFDAVRFDATGGRLVAGTVGGTMLQIDATTGQSTARFAAFENPVSAVAFIEGGSEVVATDDAGNVVIWRAGEEATAERFALCPGRAHHLVIDATGTWLGCATRDRLTIRDVMTGVERVERFEEGLVASAVALDRAAGWAAVGDDNGRVHLMPIRDAAP